MSFLTDLFEGNTGNLGNDISHAGSSLMAHPSQLWETLGGAAALATGGLALGALAPEAGAAAGGAGLFGDIFGGGAAAADAAALPGAATLDAGGGLVGGTDVASLFGGGAAPDSFLAGTGIPGADAGVAGGGLPGVAGATGGDVAPIASSTVLDPAATAGGSSIFDPSTWTLEGVGKGLGVAAAGAGLAKNVLGGSKTDPNQQQLQNQAGQLQQQGLQMESYLKKGTLPPALQAQLTQAIAAEKARIVSGYAARGQPTDPKLNSALAQDLNNVDTNALASKAAVEMQMYNTGLKETGMSTEIYQMLTQLDLQQNKDLMNSIASFAAALGGGGGGTFKMTPA